jgi:hypothetical protein
MESNSHIQLSMLGYQSKEPPQECKVVNAITKEIIPGQEEPVIFEVNYATLVMDDAETESLVVPFDMMKHGIKVDMVPPKYGGSGGITFDGECRRSVRPRQLSHVVWPVSCGMLVQV